MLYEVITQADAQKCFAELGFEPGELQAEPIEALEITVREIEAVRDLQVRRIPARVVSKTNLSPNVVRLLLRLPGGQRLQFLAGQYIDVLLPERNNFV